MEQQTTEWREWRSKGIGASDAPIIMGVSPWKTPHELFQEKTGKKKNPQKTSPAMQRGIDLEPVARAYYEIKSEIEFFPATVEDLEYPYLRASLDGWNPDLKIILEIKCPNKEDHFTAIKGSVPAKYVYQVQHQIMVANADRCDYFSFDGTRGVVVKVLPDPELIKVLRDKEILFWECVQKNVWREELFK